MFLVQSSPPQRRNYLEKRWAGRGNDHTGKVRHQSQNNMKEIIKESAMKQEARRRDSSFYILCILFKINKMINSFR